MSEDKKKSIKDRLRQLVALLNKFKKYTFPAFIAFIVIIYGFLLFKINNLSNLEPSDTAITQQIKAAKVPHIDEKVVKQLQSLQDNSVSVQALFNEARSNPFQ